MYLVDSKHYGIMIVGESIYSKNQSQVELIFSYLGDKFFLKTSSFNFALKVMKIAKEGGDIFSLNKI